MPGEAKIYFDEIGYPVIGPNQQGFLFSV